MSEARWERDPGLRAAVALAAPLAAVAGVALAAAVADALGWRSADQRFVAVSLGAAVPLVLLRVTRPGSSRAARIFHGLASLPMLAALAWPHSSLAVSYLAGGVLFHALSAGVHAARTAAQLGGRPASRAGLALLSGGLSLYFASMAFVVLFNTELVVAPVRLAHLHPAPDAGERNVVLETEDGLHLGATYTPGRPGAAGVVLVHGVADGRSRLEPWARRLRSLGYHALRIDLRAHGTSEGAVCTYGQRETRDVRAAVAWLRRAPGVDAERLAVVGASMGGGTVLASTPWLPSRGVRALVLLAPAARYGPLVDQRVRWLGPFAGAVLNGSALLAEAAGQIPMTRWSPASRVPQDALPALVFHGDADDTIPVASTLRLTREHRTFHAVIMPGVGHVAIVRAVLDDDATWSRCRAFLAAALER